MKLCLVSDRKRIGGEERLLQQFAGAVAGGIDFIQLRENDVEAAELLRLVRRIVTEIPGAASRLIVNDRLDVAIAGGASGVHLKAVSFDVDSARRLAPPPFLVGASVHGPEAAALKRRADYLIAGTVLPTQSKPSSRLLGWEGLRRVVAAAAGQPVLAIGGLSLSSARLVAESGAAGLAGVGVFIPDQGVDPGQYVQNQAGKLRKLFDSAIGVS
jgi:thiamine-phosphate diphosphorylase